MVQDAPDAAHLLAATSPARPAVHERRQRRTVAGGFPGVLGVEHQQPAVPRRDAEYHLADEVLVTADHRADQAAAPAGCERNQLSGGNVGQQRRDWPERLDLVRRGFVLVICSQQDGRQECAALRVGVQHIHPLGISRDQPPRGEQQLERPAHLVPLLQAGQCAHPYRRVRWVADRHLR